MAAVEVEREEEEGYDMLRMWAGTCVSGEKLTPFVVGVNVPYTNTGSLY